MSDRRAKHFPGIVRLYGAFNSLARLLCIPGSPILQVVSRGPGVAASGQIPRKCARELREVLLELPQTFKQKSPKWCLRGHFKHPLWVFVSGLVACVT